MKRKEIDILVTLIKIEIDEDLIFNSLNKSVN